MTDEENTSSLKKARLTPIPIFIFHRSHTLFAIVFESIELRGRTRSQSELGTGSSRERKAGRAVPGCFNFETLCVTLSFELSAGLLTAKLLINLSCVLKDETGGRFATYTQRVLLNRDFYRFQTRPWPGLHFSRSHHSHGPIAWTSGEAYHPDKIR